MNETENEAICWSHPVEDDVPGGLAVANEDNLLGALFSRQMRGRVGASLPALIRGEEKVGQTLHKEALFVGNTGKSIKEKRESKDDELR